MRKTNTINLKKRVSSLNEEIAMRKEIERDLRKANEFNLAMLKTIPFAMDIVDEKGNILFLNKQLKDKFGKNVIGKKCWSLYRDNRTKCKDCPLITGVKINETARIETDGIFGGKTFQITHTGMYYEGKLAILEIFQDITEQKKAEKELKEALTVKSEFTSMVSHELRTPLAAIKEAISIVFDEVAGQINKDQKDFLGTAKRNVDRLARLINDVLDFSKLEAGAFEFQMEENDINKLIHEVIKTETTIAEQKGLSLKAHLDEKISKIRFDYDKITQVLTNLLSNAIKFSDKGEVTVATIVKHSKNHILVSVKDAGRGIKKEDIARLFQKFQQLEVGKNRRTGGTGLGLAICKKIIDQHDGKIWAESQFGQGSVFYFALPIKERRG